MIISLYIIFSALLGSFLASFIYRYVNKNIEADAYVESINIYTGSFLHMEDNKP